MLHSCQWFRRRSAACSIQTHQEYVISKRSLECDIQQIYWQTNLCAIVSHIKHMREILIDVFIYLAILLLLGK